MWAMLSAVTARAIYPLLEVRHVLRRMFRVVEDRPAPVTRLVPILAGTCGKQMCG